jgi:predicted ferric reductase
MKQVVRHKPGYLVLAASYTLTVVVWLLTPSLEVALTSQIAQLLGALALVGFGLGNFISTRHQLIDRLFDGQDKAYVVHKWLGVSSVGLVGVHFIIFQLGRAHSALTAGHSAGGLVHIGRPSLVVFIVLILVALIAKRVDYQKWRVFHKLLIVPYVVGVVHYYGSTTYGAVALSPFSIWLNLVNVVGLASIIYTVLLYQRLAFRYRYRVVEVRSIAKATVEISGEPVRAALKFKPGQFCFVKFPHHRPRFPAHPFTISSSPNSRIIQFTIKSLGDHTDRLVAAATPGDEFVVTAANGRFDYTRAGLNQVWIAGGIGVTPFRSFYQTGILQDYSIDFFYAYHGEAEGAYLDELQALVDPNLRIHLIDDTQQGFLTAEMINQYRSTDADFAVFFCGPKPMRDALRKDLVRTGMRGFHYEEFGFGR